MDKNQQQKGFTHLILPKKLASLTLVFLFLFSPFTPVFAKETISDDSQIDTTTQVDSSISDELSSETTNSSEEQNELQQAGENSDTQPTPEDKDKLEKPIEPDPMAMTPPVTEVDPDVGFKVPTQAKASVDQSTGALIYKYSIELTEGRAGMTPELSLNYNSRNVTRPDSITGLGWELSIPYIKRVPQKGTNNLYSNPYFVSSFSGNLISTSDTSSSQFVLYRPESDGGDFLKYKYNSDNSWTVTGKDGKTYIYGAAASSRQDNSADTTQAFKWMLTSITDVNGNSIQYTYIKDQGQIYPDQINYTQHASSAAVNSVAFVYTSPSNYGATTYDTAFSVTTAKLLSTIVNTTTVGLYTSTHTYTLAYTDASFIKQKQLTMITETGSFPSQAGEYSLPTSFSYSTKTAGWENSTWSLDGYIGASYTSGNNTMYSGIRPADFDGNGYEDLLISWFQNPGNPSNNYLMMNNGRTFTDARSAWGLPETSDIAMNTEISDVNGDNLPDLLTRFGDMSGNVYLNTGSTFTLDTSHTWNPSNYVSELAPSCPINVGDHYTKENNGFLYDINGDGKNDIIYFGGTSNFKVYLNNGAGWTSSDNYTFIGGASGFPSVYPCDTVTPIVDNLQMLIDLNGDGMADYINQPYGAFLNTGSGFTYSAPYSIIRNYTEELRGGMGDINGDGLIDLVYASQYTDITGHERYCNKTYINTGIGFTKVNPSSGDTNCPSSTVWYAGPLHLDYSSNDSHPIAGTLMDINADGFPDAIINYLTGEGGKVDSINDSKDAWVTASGSWGPLVNPNKAVFFDVNADNILDFITPLDSWNSNRGSSTTRTWLGKTAVPNLLTGITNYLEGTTAITYGTAPTAHMGTDITPISVVKKISVDPKANQPVMITSYDYTGGAYVIDRATKQQRFAGFQKVTTTESGADLVPLRVTDTYFLQANGSDINTNEPTDTNLALIGKPYYSVVHDLLNTLKNQTWYRYGTYTLATDPVLSRPSTFVYPSEDVMKSTDSSGSYGTAKTYIFNTSVGEKTSIKDWGFVSVASNGTYTDVVGDTRYEYNTYATNGSGRVEIASKDIRTTTGNKGIVTKTEYFYDNNSLGAIGLQGNLTKQSDWVSGNGSVKASSVYTYDTYGNVLTVTNPIGSVTTYTYDSSNSQPATSTNHLSQTTTYTYKAGKLYTMTDPNGRLITYQYNSLGWFSLKTTQNTGGNLVEYQYLSPITAGGVDYWYIGVRKKTGTYNQETYNIIDGLGRNIRNIQLRIDDLSGSHSSATDMYITSAKSYDALGRAITQSAPSDTIYQYLDQAVVGYISPGLETTTSYDTFDRPLSVSNTLGTTTYSYAGVKTTIFDGNNHQKKMKNDAYGNLIEVREYGAKIYITSYTYDIRNLLTNITDALGNVRNFLYNNAGWLTNSEDLHASGDGSYGNSQFTYDNDGNILTETQPNGIVISRTYDALDRLVTVSDSGTTGSYIFTYDSCPSSGIGRLCAVSGTLPNGVTLSKAFTYAASLMPTSSTITTLGNTYTTNYEYTVSDQVRKITYPNGTIVRTDYGDWSLPAHTYVTLPSTSEMTYATYIYDNPTQKIAQIDRFNGLTTYYTYDSGKLYRLSRIQSLISSTQYQDLQYAYDSVGNITKITEPDTTKMYTYDKLDRLIRAVYTPLSGVTTTYTYAYDPIGNITTGNGFSYTYSATGKTNPNAVTSIGTNSYTYDSNGNLITGPNQVLIYNWQNQPTRITLAGTTNIDSSYDEAGNRFIYKTPTNTEIQVSADYLLRNTAPEINIKLSDTPVGKITNNILYGTIADNLNTAIKQINSVGTASETVTYDPFGKILTQTGSLNTKNGYTGHEEDLDTGLVYAQARYYNPATLRFNQQDPSSIYIASQNFKNLIGVDRNQILLDPQQLNSYSYVRNNPINMSDPSGDITIGEAAKFINNWLMRLFNSQESVISNSTPVVQSSSPQNIDLGSSSWVSQYSLPNPGGACLRACNQISGYVSDSSRSINMATYDNNKNLNTLPGNTGIDTINNYLLNGQKVTVGVNRGDGNENMTTPNHASEHFISINGKYSENGNTYYTFLDPGTHSQESGTSSNNRLYLNPNGSLTGKTAYNKNYHYTVTEVRLK